MFNLAEFKNTLYTKCKALMQMRMETAAKAMNEAQMAANGEEKSSAGDKYETGRAMGHRERDMYARQFAEAKIEGQKLETLHFSPLKSIAAGSLVEANEMYYFIAVAIGKLEIDGKAVMVVSGESPLAKAMQGKTKGDTFLFNGKIWKIKDVH